ncbi:MAG: YcxB-like protein [Verrucomicrobiota bacterium]|jgi:hypothetical protein
MNPPPLLQTTHRYELRRKDLFLAQFIGLLHSKVAIGLLILLMVYGAYTLSTSDEAMGQSLAVRILAAMFAMLIVILFWILFHLVIVSTLVFGRKHKGLLGGHTLVLTDAGLIEKTEYNENLHRWNGFHKIRDTIGYYYIFVTDTLFHLVPKRSFKSPTDAQRFIDEIRQRAALK